MSELYEKLYAEAMTMPEPDRVTLANDLLDSVEASDEDDEADPEAQALWDAEIDRRIAEIDSGKVVGLTHEEMMSKIRTKYKWES